jgi:hypothetical protein
MKCRCGCERLFVHNDDGLVLLQAHVPEGACGHTPLRTPTACARWRSWWRLGEHPHELVAQRASAAAADARRQLGRERGLAHVAQRPDAAGDRQTHR